jgi:hypothetical protein
MLSARAPGKLALGVPVILFVALMALYLALHGGPSSIPASHSGPAVVPASVQGGENRANQPSAGSATTNQSSSGAEAQSQAPATRAGQAPKTVVSGRPEDAGPDVVKQGSGSSQQVCAPKLCWR